MLGGPVTHDYQYDGFYRLKEARGTYTGNQNAADYALLMEYGQAHQITKKVLYHKHNGEFSQATNYTLDYGYNTSQGPYHGVKQIKRDGTTTASPVTETEFLYDANGNTVYQN
ncbi:MAG: hypothetical protein ACK5IC_01400 [Moheibacter sp.]